MAAARSRTCRLCGTSSDGVFGQCNARYRDAQPAVVIARGARDELALVPMSWDGVGEIGCPELGMLCLVRPRAFAGEDGMAADVIKAAGGNLWSSSGFDDDASRVMVRATSMALAWEVAGVYPVVEADAEPQRLLAEPDGPSYGRWPAPWVSWMSIADVIPWRPAAVPSVREGRRRGISQDAFAAVGLGGTALQDLGSLTEIAPATASRLSEKSAA